MFLDSSLNFPICLFSVITVQAVISKDVEVVSSTFTELQDIFLGQE